MYYIRDTAIMYQLDVIVENISCGGNWIAPRAKAQNPQHEEGLQTAL